MHYVQFLGIILFIVTKGGSYEAVLPAIPGHDSLVLADASKNPVFDPPSCKADRLKAKDGTYWDFAVLNGETITFDRNNVPVSFPCFLIHMNDDCCRMMGSVRKEYLKENDPKHAKAHVTFDEGDAGWALGNGRVDTVVRFGSSYGNTLKIHIGASCTLTLDNGGNAVVANFPKDYIVNQTCPNCSDRLASNS